MRRNLDPDVGRWWAQSIAVHSNRKIDKSGHLVSPEIKELKVQGLSRAPEGSGSFAFAQDEL
jgi:hypothetical protein